MPSLVASWPVDCVLAFCNHLRKVGASDEMSKRIRRDTTTYFVPGKYNGISALRLMWRNNVKPGTETLRASEVECIGEEKARACNA